MKPKPLTETYYAVQIGNEKLHTPYFMLSIDDATPALFSTREDAKARLPKHDRCKVVKVAVTVIK